jgi:hypothetical protein
MRGGKLLVLQVVLWMVCCDQKADRVLAAIPLTYPIQCLVNKRMRWFHRQKRGCCLPRKIQIEKDNQRVRRSFVNGVIQELSNGHIVLAFLRTGSGLAHLAGSVLAFGFD